MAAALEDGSIAIINTGRKVSQEDSKKPGTCDMKIFHPTPRNNQHASIRKGDRNAPLVHPSNMGLVYARGYIWHMNDCTLGLVNTSHSDRLHTRASPSGSMSFQEYGCTEHIDTSAFQLPAVACKESSTSCNSTLLCQGFQCARADAGPLFSSTQPFQSTTRQSRGLLVLLDALIPKTPVAIPNPFITIAVASNPTDTVSSNGSAIAGVKTTVFVYHSKLSYEPQVSALDMYANYGKVFLAIIIACALMWWRRSGDSGRRTKGKGSSSSRGYGLSPTERYESLHSNLRGGNGKLGQQMDQSSTGPDIGDLKKELSGLRSQLSDLRSG